MEPRPTANDPDIAVIGMVGRFPGARDLVEFWELLRHGREGISRFDDDQLVAAGVRPDLLRDPGYVRAHGVLPDVELFDTAFFEVTPADAELIDPQQRIFLESCHAALESAGHDPARFDGLIGVYAGSAINTYLQRHVLPAVDQTLMSKHFQVMVGNDKDYLATRVSYKLNLTGPSYTVQTACSTSLVAIHLACQGLLAGECDLAIAGGVTVKLPQVTGYLYEDGAILSADGRVRPFDAGATGTVLGNGVGVVVLRPLRDAVADGDTIHAVIKGTATNNDGARKVSYAAPGRDGQAAVIADAHAVSGVDPATVGYVEAHGTATRLGDPVEVSALTSAFRRGTDRRGFCAIGSVKSNVGHLDAAAGVAGVIKAALMLRHRTLVPSLNFETPNPDIDFADGPFYVNTQTRDWVGEGTPRRAGVSSFGIGGTNAHAVLEEAPDLAPSDPSPTPQLLVLSAKDPQALQRLAGDLADHLAEHPELKLADVAYTLAVGRGAYRYRSAVLCRDLAEAVSALRSNARRGPGADRDAGAAGPDLPVEALRRAWLAGEAVDWDGLYAGQRRRRVPLPTYPFQGRRCWLPATPAPAGAHPAAGPARSAPHPLLDTNVSTLRAYRYATTRTGTEPYLADHVVSGEPVLPAAACLEMARAAGSLVAEAPVTALRGVTFERPLSYAGGPRTSYLSLTRNDGVVRFVLDAAAGDVDGDVYARGDLLLADGTPPPDQVDLGAVRDRCPSQRPVEECYELLAASGLSYGPTFRVLRELRYGPGEALSTLEIPDACVAGFDGFGMHPSLLDGALQTVVVLLAASRRGVAAATYLPLALDRLDVYGRLPRRCLVHVVSPPGDAEAKVHKVDVAVLDPDGHLVARISQLAVRVRSRRTSAGSPPVLLRAGWMERSAGGAGPSGSAAGLAGPHLLLADQPARRDALLAALRTAGHGAAPVVLVLPGAAFARRDARSYTLDPASADDFVRLLAALADDGLTPASIVHAWNDHAAVAADIACLDGGWFERGVCSLLFLTKALTARRGTGTVRLLYVHPLTGDGVPPHEAVAAFARTVALENPRLAYRTVGVEPGVDAVPLLLGELGSDEAETEVRHAGGRRQVRRHQRIDPEVEATGAVTVRDGGVYLISGGGGGLGLVFAEYLTSRAEAHIVLFGRSEASPALRDRIAAIGRRAASVRYLRADVADAGELRAAVASTRAECGEIRGVIHAAGVLRDGLLLTKTPAEFAAVVTPKALGAVHLDRCTADDPLDFFVTFSSVAAAFGSVGQADYAYANAFLDAYAPHRERLVAEGRRSGRTVSIAWPQWCAGGMRQDEQAAAAMKERLGLDTMSTADGLAAFEAAVGCSGGALLVAAGDADRIEAALAGTVGSTGPGAGDRHASGAGDRDAAGDAEELRRRAGRLLREVLARETKLDADHVDERASLERYGIDSLTITRLNRELGRDFDALPTTLFYEYTTLDELAGYLVTNHAARLRALTGAPPGSVTRGDRMPVAERIAARPLAAEPVGGQERDDAIAVVGLSGRYPMADDLDELWANLVQGRDCVTEVPRERWDHGHFYDPDPARRGRAYSKWGGFLRDADRFDPLFFAISPRQAELMDPQERLFLQTAWHAVEDAGYRRAELEHRQVGVFVGVMYGEYQLYGAADALAGGRAVTGSSFASIANRVSYALNLDGPSLAVDTMCSSSLTAIHLACASLRSGETELAIAGGVNLSLHPYKYIFLSQGRYVSADGRCRAFGAGGSGYVPGEGVGAVLLKPRRAAVADGDHIHGLILGSAINHGGKTNGYTVPNPNAQERVIVRAMRHSGVQPRDITYVEAHGTGTLLGDPIEIIGLTKAYRAVGGGWPVEDGWRCAIGSVKSNIGHAESAAGVAGLTKVLLQLRHGRLVPSLHADEPNPNIDFGASPFVVQRECREWTVPRVEGRSVPRRAGLSSFGAGGANAHLVIEEYVDPRPGAELPCTAQRLPSPVPFVLSARDVERLRDYAGSLGRFLETARVRLCDVAYTLQVGREEMGERLAVVTADGAAVAAALSAFARDGDAAVGPCGLYRGTAAAVPPASGAAAGVPAGTAIAAAALASAWTAGAGVDWERLGRVAGDAHRIPLPTYPFARERYWLPAAAETTVDEPGTRLRLRGSDPDLRDHVIAGRRLLAGAAVLEMVRAAAERAGRRGVLRLRDVMWGRPVVVDGEERDVEVLLRPEGDGAAFELVCSDGDRGGYVRGTVEYRPVGYDEIERQAAGGVAADDMTTYDLDAIRRRCPRRKDGAEVYREYREAGFEYGPTYRVVQEVHIGAVESLVRLRLPESSGEYRASGCRASPPALLDGALRACHWVGRESAPAAADLAVPFSLGTIEFRAPLPDSCYAYARLRSEVDGGQDAVRRFDVALLDERGVELVRVHDFAGRPPVGWPGGGPDDMAMEPFWYEPAWVAAAAPGAAGDSAPVLLVLTDGTGTAGTGGGAELAVRLAGTGRWPRVVEVRPGRAFAAGTDRYTIDPRDPAHYRRVVDELAGGAFDVVHGWSLGAPPDGAPPDGAPPDGTPPDGTPATTLSQTQAGLRDSFDRGLLSVLLLLQAVHGARVSGRVRCAYLHEIVAGDAGPADEALAGLGLSTGAAVPQFELFTVGCPPSAATDGWFAAGLAAELASGERHRGAEIRYDAEGRRYVRRVRRLDATDRPGAAVPLKERGVYVLAGGAGAIGSVFARYLAERYRARLVLLGRSPLAEPVRAELERLGAEVLAVRADVAVADDVERALAATRDAYGRIDGVLHLAGIADDTAVSDADAARFGRVLAAKTYGIVNLDVATRDDPLDLFVAFSSMSSLTGDFGAGSYAAANRFLDAYATRRERWRREGHRSGRTLSLGWPLWAVGGVDALLSAQQRDGYRRRTGAAAFTAVEGLRAFEDAWRFGRERLVPAFGDHRVEQVLGVVAEPPVALVDGEAAPVDGEAALSELVEHLRRRLAGVLRLEPSTLDSREQLAGYGLDSVLIMEANALLGRDFDRLPSTLFFDHRTIADVARYLLREHHAAVTRLLGAEAAQPAAGPSTQIEAPARIEPPTRTPPVGRVQVRQDPGAAAPAGTAAGDIAIIGISGRYPHARDLDEFWENLRCGRDCVTEIPAARWDAEAIFDADPAAAGRSYGRWGGFLADVDAFDSLFFQLSPARAKMMDPQERLFLETATAALEDAGYPLAALPAPRFSADGRDVGVFVGVMWDDYAILGAQESLRGNHVVALANRASIANQVSYFGDFRGPSVVVDTACSASLVALHLACESLRRRECRYAIAGGVNVSVHPLKYVHLSRKAMLARDGRCRAFGDGGTGYVPGEGVGAVLLKPLSAAVADGDHIHAVIRASAVNHGGRTGGFTVPNPQAQEALVVEALERAGIDARTIGCVEAHGTGTTLGDPIEHAALQRAFARHTGDRGFCSLGSVKSGIGHLEGAAGIAGVAKVVLQMRHGELAPTLHVDQPNPAIDFTRSPFTLQRELAPWRRPVTDGVEGPRRAGVSSFGAGGTNAHIILEEYRPPATPPHGAGPACGDPDGPELLVLSARTEERLRAYASMLADFLRRAPASGVGLADVAYTLRVGREAMPARLAFVARGPGDAATRLAAFGRGEQVEGLARGNADRSSALAGLFTGAGGGREFLRGLVDAGEDAKLAELWASGLTLDWGVLHEARPRARRRIPLPTYPFARERHWLTARPATPAVTRVTLRPDDPFVADHRVDGRRILPGVAHLDLALAAAAAQTADAGGPTGLADVRWSAPVVVDEATEVTIAVTVDGGASRYELRSGASTVHSRGVLLSIVADDQPVRLPLDEIRARCPRELSHVGLYGGLAELGLEYGPYFRAVERVWVGDGEALGRLRLVQGPRAGRHALHPGMTDAALHTIAGLWLDERVPGAPLLLPFAVDRVDLARSLPECGYSYVRSLGAQRCDVTLADDAGRVCVRLRGLAYREQRDTEAQFGYTPRWVPEPASLPESSVPGAERPADGAARALILTLGSPNGLAAVQAAHAGAEVVHVSVGPDGMLDPNGDVEAAVERALAQSGRPDVVYFLGGVGAVVDATDAVMTLYRLVRVLDRRGALREPLRLKVVTSDVFPLGGSDVSRPGGAGLHGFCAALDNEYPGLRIACVDVRGADLAAGPDGDGSADALASAVAAEPYPARTRPVLLRGGVRYARRLAPVRLPRPERPRLRTSGVYLIVGGLGAVGFDTSVYLAATYRARLVLVGRGELDAARREKIARIERAGGEVLYLACDATDPAAMCAAVQRARARFGALHGAVHSAMLLVTEPVAGLDPGSLRAALAAKIDTTRNLYEAVRDEALDFLLLYSSAVTFAGNGGQTGYAAGCAVADAYALHLRRSAAFPVQVLNWGYWHAAGIEERARALVRLATAGITPIGAAEGMRTVERVLGCGVPQLVATKAPGPVLAAMGVEPGLALRRYPPRLPPLARDVVEPARLDPDELAYLVAYQRGAAEAERLARRLALAAVQRLGVLREPGERLTRAGLGARLGVVPGYARLFDALLGILAASGYLRLDGDGTVVAMPALAGHEERLAATDPDAAVRALAAAHPGLEPVLRLLIRSTAALPAVLSGTRNHVEVLFPDGSADLVAAVYRGNPVADRYHEMLAATVRRYVRRRLDADPDARIRVLEVGAGTGSASGPLLAALAPYASNVRYLFTDVSTAFVRHGRRQFADAYPFAEFALLDIQAPPAARGGTVSPGAGSGFEPDTFDIVVGANVFHATRRIGHTLRQVKRLLRANGLLLAVEGTRPDPVMTLIFGLADGWWAAEDAWLRLPGSPLLDAVRWRDALGAGGYRDATVVELPATAGGAAYQSLLVAESDGMAAGDPVDAVDAVDAVDVGGVAVPVRPAASAEERHRAAVEYVTGVFARVLELPVARIDAAATFERYGVDSLVVLELTRELEEDLGQLPATLLFERITIDQLARYLVAEQPAALARVTAVGAGAAGVQTAKVPAGGVAGQVAAVGQVAAAEQARLREAVERFSDADVDRLLSQLVAVLGESPHEVPGRAAGSGG